MLCMTCSLHETLNGCIPLHLLAQVPVGKDSLESAACLSTLNTHCFEADNWLSAVALPSSNYASRSGSHCRDCSIVCGDCTLGGKPARRLSTDFRRTFANGRLSTGEAELVYRWPHLFIYKYDWRRLRLPGYSAFPFSNEPT